MDPPGYSYTKSTSSACHFCAHERDVGRWAACTKYECRTYLDCLCDSFESLGDRERPLPTPEELKRLEGPWLKYPERGQTTRMFDSDP